MRVHVVLPLFCALLITSFAPPEAAAQVADLSIDKSDDGTDALAGANYDYDIAVTNNGPDTSSGWTVTDTLPAGWSFFGSNVNCAGDGLDPETVTCTRNASQAVGSGQTSASTKGWRSSLSQTSSRTRRHRLSASNSRSGVIASAGLLKGMRRRLNALQVSWRHLMTEGFGLSCSGLG